MTIYSDGTVTVWRGSMIVAGRGTAWRSEMFGGRFRCAQRDIAILAVSSSELTLLKPWDGPDLKGAPYEILYSADQSPAAKALKDAMASIASVIEAAP